MKKPGVFLAYMHISAWILLIFCMITACAVSVSAAGSVSTAGDTVMKTDELRNQTGADGTGIIVGVISNGAKGYSDAQKSGDLPENLLILNEGKRSEGTAMMEIVHDIAPNATLVYSDFGGGKEEKFIESIKNLVQSGATIIVEDVGNGEVPYFEDGTIASEVQKILSEYPDILYVSAAGNNGDMHYQGIFTSSGDGYQSFNGSTGIPVEIQPGGRITVILQWDDPFNAAKNDFDLSLYDVQNDADIASSNKVQIGEEKPLEKIIYQNVGDKPQKVEIRVKAKEGNPDGNKTLELILNIQKDKVHIQDGYLVPNDSIIGQAATSRVISVAAVPSSGEQKIQDFSSRGTVTISNPSADIRKKPDITGTDNVQVTGSGGFTPLFTGTSAAAPHIAGLLALMKSLYPSLSAEVLKEAMFASATDLGDPGWDPEYGYGLADAMGMLKYLKDKGYEPLPASSNQTAISPEVTLSPRVTEKPVASEYVITESAVLSKPGNYVLGDDITDYSESILTLSSSDIHIDGAGHTISGVAVRFGTDAPVLQSGILVWSSENRKLSNITVSNLNITGTYAGISARNTEGLTIDSCGLLYNTRGIDLFQSGKVTIKNSGAIGNGYAGILSDAGSGELVIGNNQITGNLYGLILDGSASSQVIHNMVSGNHYDGIMLNHGVSGCVIDNNICSGNKNGGISLYSSLHNQILNNTCNDNNPHGILLHESSENQISGNRLLRNIRGINLYFSDSNTITGNDFIGNDATGVMLQPSGHNVLSHNRIISNFAEGILITSDVGSDQQNLIANNYIENDQNVRVQEKGKPNYRWNEPVKNGVNIVGGPFTGGNAWSLPNGTGYSQTCQDMNGDGICDLSYSPVKDNSDEAPLKYAGQPLTPSELSKLGPAPEPKTAEDWVTRGKILMGSSDYADAIEAYEKAITLAPTNYQAWRDKALSLKAMGRYDEAFVALHTILAVYPENPELWSTAGDIYLVDLQKYPDSVPFYEKAITLDEQDIHALVNLAFAYDKTGRTDEALQLYRKALQINPSLTDAWNKAGNILTRAGQYDEAVRMFDNALELDPGSAFVLNNKGYALYLAGKYPEAIESYQKALAVDSKYTAAWKNLGATYEKMGRITDSKEAYAKAG